MHTCGIMREMSSEVIHVGTWHGRRRGARGYMALVNIQGEVEDKIFVLFGGSMLYVLRPKDDKYILIGECYVHGLMDGEAMRYLREGLVSEEDIFIV